MFISVHMTYAFSLIKSIGTWAIMGAKLNIIN